MTTATYKYFRPDSVLRSEYGGAAIQAGGDSAEVSAATLCVRYLCVKLGLPAGRTEQLFQLGTASGNTWFKVSDNFYTAISPHLSAYELSTVQSSAPSGYANSSATASFQPSAHKTNVIIRGDSILAGLGTTTGDTRDIWPTQAINAIPGQTLSGSTPFRVLESDDYRLINMSLGSSSFANTVAPNNTYPLREDLAYNQRTKTIPPTAREIFILWLGTNDISYDGTVTGADAWARAATRISALAADRPLAKIIATTIIKRSNGPNTYNNDFNTLMRANYMTAGAHVLCDLEANVPECNIGTGDTTNTTYYTDTVHLTTTAHGLCAVVGKAAILAAEALF